MVRLEGVGLRYGTGPYVLQEMNFTLPARSVRLLPGASGAGETRPLRLLMAACRPGGVLPISWPTTPPARRRPATMP